MDKNCSKLVNHTIDPVYNKNSRILILGTMPSVKSREAQFFYMHPQNLFWRVLADLLAWEFPKTVSEKKEMLLKNKIAVWDVLKCCEIEGSSDSSIKNPIPNDFSGVFSTADIKAVFTTGATATSLFNRYCSKITGIESIYLPSTSPANKKYYSYDKIYDEWKKILPFIK